VKEFISGYIKTLGLGFFVMEVCICILLIAATVAGVCKIMAGVLT